MANRSTFQSECTRETKRMLSYLGKFYDNNRVGELKALMLKAHANHRNFKNKRFSGPVAEDTGDEA